LTKFRAFFLIGLFDVSLIATVGTLWFQVPFRGLAILFLLCMLGVGLLISTVSATQQQAMVTSSLLHNARRDLLRFWLPH
jgi:ABC-2 type transport system permease protein